MNRGRPRWLRTRETLENSRSSAVYAPARRALSPPLLTRCDHGRAGDARSRERGRWAAARHKQLGHSLLSAASGQAGGGLSLDVEVVNELCRNRMEEDVPGFLLLQRDVVVDHVLCENTAMEQVVVIFSERFYRLFH